MVPIDLSPSLSNFSADFMVHFSGCTSVYLNLFVLGTFVVFSSFRIFS